MMGAWTTLRIRRLGRSSVSITRAGLRLFWEGTSKVALFGLTMGGKSRRYWTCRQGASLASRFISALGHESGWIWVRSGTRSASERFLIRRWDSKCAGQSAARLTRLAGVGLQGKRRSLPRCVLVSPERNSVNALPRGASSWLLVGELPALDSQLRP
jgi:hypothetical protein